MSRHRFGALVFALFGLAGDVGAQDRLVPFVQIGAYRPPSKLGSFGAAEGRMEAGPTLGIGLDVNRLRGIFGARLTAVRSLRRGARFVPTSACLVACGSPSSVPYQPRFVAAGLDLTAQVRLGPAVVLAAAAGPALRGYDGYSSEGVYDPLPGHYLPYEVDEIRPGGHLGGRITIRTGFARWLVSIDDYIGRFRVTRRTQHDMILSAGVGVELAPRPDRCLASCRSGLTLR